MTKHKTGNCREVIMILQIGSLGDTVISIPCYREIARRHPESDRYLITNYPIGSKMVPAEDILLPTALISASLEYPMPLRRPAQAVTLWRKIRALKPDALYYLLPETRTANLIRHMLFFRACGIRQIYGLPWARKMRQVREVVPQKLWESEASRLLRTIGAQPGPLSNADRDLALTPAELTRAAGVIKALGSVKGIVAISVGGKVPINNWGDDRWRATLARLSVEQPSLGALFLGSEDERQRNELLATVWKGPRLNTCGQFTPRETAALTSFADVFLGHDTGTLHLAAAVDTPVVGIFSARNRAGKWFSDRPRDVFFYNHVPCESCELVQVKDCTRGWVCMSNHSQDDVVKAVQQIIAESR